MCSGVSCVIFSDRRMLCDFTLDVKSTHSQNLMPLIDSCLKFCKYSIDDMDVIVTSNGPGSFTGLRIVLSTVKALAHFKDIKLYTVSTLLGLAMSEPYFDGYICPHNRCRRDEVYSGLYRKVKSWKKEDVWNIHDFWIV